MTATTTPGWPNDDTDPAGLLRTLLTLSLTAVALLRPVYGADGETIADFAWQYLNPAGQRLLGQPERPAASLLTLFPTTQADGVFGKCRRAFETGELQRHQADGPAGCFVLVAQRQDDLLVVNFTAANDQPRPAVEVALGDSQGREQPAREQAEAQRQRFYDVLQQLPAQVAIFTGPDHVCSFVNQRFTAYMPAAAILGRPVREVAAGALSDEVLALYDRVYQTGEVAQAWEVEAQLAARRPGAESVFLDTCCYPLHDADGHVYGVLDFSYDVTPQVLARRQVGQLNRELAARTEEARQVQAATERGQAQLQALLTQAPVAIALFQGEEVRVATANERMAALWGRTPAQVLGLPLVEAVPELRGQGFDDMIRQVAATRVPYVGTEAPATILKDGKMVVRYYDYSCQPIYGAQGELLGVLNVGAEVTGQVEARRALERHNQELEARVQERTRELAEQRALLDQILGQVPAAIATLRGPAHRFAFANDRYQHLVGSRVQLGQSVAEALPEVVEQGVIELLDRVYQTGEPFIGQGVMIMLEQPPGPPHQFYYDLTYQPLRDGEGQVQGILVFAVEVTEQVRARRQTALLQAELLQATERRAQERQHVLQVFANAPVAVALLREPDHQLDYWNALLDQYFPGAERGRPLEQVLPALATPEVVAQLDRLYKNGETYQSEPLLLPGATPEAALRYVIFTYQAYRENGQVAGVALFLQDVTGQVLSGQQVQHLNEELTATNQELQHSNARLTSTNADLDTFIYTASHDLKAPISNIEGLIEALRQELADAQLATPDVAHLLQLMDGSVARFQETIGQLTGILQQQAGQRGQEHTSLARIIGDVQLDLAGTLEATQAQVLVEVAACPSLRLSPKDLRSVVYNLLSNALKYRSPGRPPVVRIHATCAAGQAELRVQDNGLGLSAAQQARLFQLFQRQHLHVEGSGVGLYAIRKLIENAGGTIRVESGEGVGSTFVVQLPA